MSFNVLQLVGSFHQGGSERQAVQLARLLSEDVQTRVHLATLDAAGVLRADAERLNVGEIPEFRLTSFYDANFARQLRRFARFVREREIDVIHTHDFYTNVFGMAGATLARVPVRVASKRETTGMRTRAQKIVQRGAFALAHAVVVNAEAVRRDLEREGVPPRKIVTVYNGLDVRRCEPPANFSRANAAALFGLPRDERLRFVTIVANLRHDVKDHPTFLRAARRVREAFPDARFVIAGEGELTEPMRALAASYGLSNEVFFTGRCERVAELLYASDVCVLSSKAEGFSNAILEYMAAARPVVCTDVGGAREAVVEGKTGYVVAVGDDALMAERIVELLRDAERARLMGERGRERVARDFSCEAQLERTLGLYERLLAARSPSTDLAHAGERARTLKL
ncbi:MAG: L-malate glycosyltransferase [Acidobacteriota bacterium]|nr:L-malate glycosyltransferase [Acidobacteriota bacterium]